RRAKEKDDSISHFMVDASATAALAYGRAAGVYTVDKDAGAGESSCAPARDGHVLHERAG
ncbi:MAG TPA: hypothetical protein VGC82_11215, partial [Rhodopila sp.]